MAHDGVVPTTVVDQLPLPAMSVSVACVVGATALMSGATTGEDSAAALATVNVEAEPKPPRMPAADVVLPGEIVSRFVPKRGDLGGDLGLRALAEPDGQDHRGNPDEDAENGQPGAQPVTANSVEPRTEGLEPGHRTLSKSRSPSSSVTNPSRMPMTRPAADATPTSWVMRTRVRPAS